MQRLWRPVEPGAQVPTGTWGRPDVRWPGGVRSAAPQEPFQKFSSSGGCCHKRDTAAFPGPPARATQGRGGTCWALPITGCPGCAGGAVGGAEVLETNLCRQVRPALRRCRRHARSGGMSHRVRDPGGALGPLPAQPGPASGCPCARPGQGIQIKRHASAFASWGVRPEASNIGSADGTCWAVGGPDEARVDTQGHSRQGCAPGACKFTVRS